MQNQNYNDMTNASKYSNIFAYNLTYKYFIYSFTSILLISSFGANRLFSQSVDTTRAEVAIDTNTIEIKKIEIKKIILGDVQIGFGIDSLDKWKIHAALSLATKITGKYELISNEDIDSLKSFLEYAPSLSEAFDSLEASYFAFVSVNRLENMLGLDLKLKNNEYGSKILMGRGYSNLSFQIGNSGLKIYDPPLLRAMQRAFAGAIKDTMLYDSLKGDLKVYPAAATVIGGIKYIDNDNLRKWDLFETKVVSSYFACETIFEHSYQNNFYEIYDLASRDSIYSMYRLYGVENYDLPSSHELKALEEMDVEYYITGQFIRTDEGAELKLYLSKISGQNLRIIKKAEATLKEDSLEKYGNLLKELTLELFPK